MSWLISLIVAGLVFNPDANIPQPKQFNAVYTERSKVVKLDETERFEQTYPLNSNGRVSVSNVNGSITVETWNRSEVKLEAIKTADSKERLSEVEIKIDSRQDRFSVETDYDSWKRRNGGEWKDYGKLVVDYKLMVPENAVLDEIETVNGTVRITGSNTFTKASAVNGQVFAINLRGAANISTVNGTVEASFEKLEPASKINLDTVNGQVNISIPSDSNVTLKAETVNGKIENEFGLPVRKGQYVGKDLYGRVGSGEVQVNLNSVNGGLFIKRNKDGRNPNPATNLLPAKSEDDTWVGSTPKVVNVPRMNREISRAMVQSQKELEKAQKEMALIAPQIDKATVEALEKTGEAIKMLNSEEMKATIKEAQMRQLEGLLRISEAGYVTGLPAVERKNGTYAVKGKPKVSVDAPNCKVTVRGWDRPEVKYNFTRVTRGPSPKPVDIQVDSSDTNVSINVLNNDESANGGFFVDAEQVRLEVFVPKKSDLRIHTNGEIRLEDVTGNIEVKGGDEAVNVRNVEGKLNIASVDGRIRVIGFRGELESTSADGGMSLEGDFEKLTAKSEDGAIVLTIPDDANVSIQSNKNDIRAEGLPFVFVNATDTGSLYRIGKGGENYRVDSGAGEVLIRSSNSLKSAF